MHSCQISGPTMPLYPSPPWHVSALAGVPDLGADPNSFTAHNLPCPQVCQISGPTMPSPALLPAMILPLQVCQISRLIRIPLPPTNLPCPQVCQISGLIINNEESRLQDHYSGRNYK